MTPTQREAALRLIEGGEPSNRLMPDELEAWADDAAALLQELLAAEPVQEPVGYMPAVGLNHLRSGSGPVGVWPTQAEGYEPVYAAPQQRKPLTDEQILEIRIELVLSPNKYHSHYGWSIEFARQIEAAHGIKETP